MAGKSAKDTIAACAGSRFAEGYAHHIIGVDSLANGHRQAAKSHYRSSIDLKFLNLISAQWSKSFLGQIEQNPTWPPWISRREDDEATNTTERATENGSDE